MERRILVSVPELTEAQRAEIAAAAEACGFSARFCDDPEEALKLAEEAEIILGQDARLPAAAPKLRWMATPFAGVDGFLRQASFRSDEVLLTCSAGAYGVTISEHVVWALLDLMRRGAEYRAVTAERSWDRGLPVRSIHGSRVTVLGTGDIGTACAVRLRGFQPARITGVSRRGLPNPAFDAVCRVGELDGLLPVTDVLIMALPGTPETAGLMNRQRLNRLPSDAILVNVGRGISLDQKALEEVLRAGTLGGAALDVFETEPLPPEDSLWDCPRLLLTPHIAGNMTLPYTVERIKELFIENLGRYSAGEPLRSLVNRARGY
ncbi:MAG: D-2-hydroxyacid dehydrogenase [Clostridia bacterium]|nr:D-2-hydroxyacid dehydrogenase [Clostridia bacterium]